MTCLISKVTKRVQLPLLLPIALVVLAGVAAAQDTDMSKPRSDEVVKPSAQAEEDCGNDHAACMERVAGGSGTASTCDMQRLRCLAVRARAGE